jgi:hypothetical protein
MVPSKSEPGLRGRGEVGEVGRGEVTWLEGAIGGKRIDSIDYEVLMVSKEGYEGRKREGIYLIHRTMGPTP